MTPIRLIGVGAATVLLLVVVVAGLVVMGRHTASSKVSSDLKPYGPELVANALRSLTDYEIRLQDLAVPTDGVTKFVAAGTATYGHTSLNFAIVGRKEGFNSSPRTYWMPIVPGRDDTSMVLSWSNIEFATDSGVSYSDSGSNRKRARYVRRKRAMSEAFVKALTKQIGESPVSVLQ